MTQRVICIARIQGAGGDDIGRMVADGLGYRLVDEEIVQRAAESEGIAVEELFEVERRRSVIDRLLESLALTGSSDAYTVGVAPSVPPLTAMIDPRSLRALIQRSIHETADGGGVVIVSHAASYALAGRPDVLRVLITASPATRLARIAEANGLDDKKATKAMDSDDAGRADYLKKFYDVSQESPSHYDLVLNSDLLSADVISSIVTMAARAI